MQERRSGVAPAPGARTGDGGRGEQRKGPAVRLAVRVVAMAPGGAGGGGDWRTALVTVSCACTLQSWFGLQR